MSETCLEKVNGGVIKVSNGECVGCETCIDYCPKGIISIHPDQDCGYVVKFSNINDCPPGCSECVDACPLGVFEVQK